MLAIKENSHGNQLLVSQSDNKLVYEKSAMNEQANHLILAENQGYNWFGIKTLIAKEGDLYKLVIPAFFGKTFPQYNGITGNEEWISKLLEFYKVKWNEGKYAIHGDLCLCNVIFGEHIYVIDWEHFHYASKEYYGFDMLNALFIHLQYEYRWLSYCGFNWIPFIKQSHKDFIRECHRKLGDTGFLRQPFTNSAWYIAKYMGADKFILGKQKPEVLESLDIICK